MKYIGILIISLISLISCQGSEEVETPNESQEIQPVPDSSILGAWWSEEAGIINITEDLYVISLPFGGCQISSMTEIQLELVDCPVIGDEPDSVTYEITRNEDGSIMLTNIDNPESVILLEDLSVAAEYF